MGYFISTNLLNYSHQSLFQQCLSLRNEIFEVLNIETDIFWGAKGTGTSAPFTPHGGAEWAFEGPPRRRV